MTIYATVITLQSLWGWYVWLAGSDRYIGLLRRYLIVHGLRLRFTAFWGDVIICAAAVRRVPDRCGTRTALIYDLGARRLVHDVRRIPPIPRDVKMLPRRRRGAAVGADVAPRADAASSPPTSPSRQLSELPKDELEHLAEEFGLDPTRYKTAPAPRRRAPRPPADDRVDGPRGDARRRSAGAAGRSRSTRRRSRSRRRSPASAR